MIDRAKQFDEALNEFPEAVREILQTIPGQAGRLYAQQCTQLIGHLGIDPAELMARLLPLARIYAVAPVSRFQVGAVAMAAAGRNAGQTDLFLGANLEFMHQPLNQTIHAEQSVTVHAWHQGAYSLQAIAASEAPCGYCRQFLYEFDKNAEITVITPARGNSIDRKNLLSELLPQAFGPLDLQNQAGLMAADPPDRNFRLKEALTDRIVGEALSAAEKSYAPYTSNFAGCALQTQTGEIFQGRYVESAAYNPSLTSLHSAIICMNMAASEENRSVQRVVLAEKPTAVCQRGAVELLLGTWAPGVELEYFEIK